MNPDYEGKPGIVLFLGAVRRGEFENLQKHGLQLGILVDTNSKARQIGRAHV